MRTIASALALLLAMLAAGCNGEVVGGGQRTPARLVVVSGDLQTDTVGQELAQPLVVRVVDERDRPVPNQLVNFVVTAGGGSVFAGSAITNAQGEARERWTLGTVAGDTQRVEARAVDPATGQAIVFATFRAIGVPDAPAAASAVGATSRTGAAGTAVTDSLAIRVVDRYGNGVPGVAVTFAAANGGSVSPATATTRADGTARAQWTLGPATGQQTATATAAGLPTVTFTAAAGPGAVTRVVLTPESISFDAVGQTQALTVEAYDAFGNMVGGQQAMIVSQNDAVVALDAGAIARASGSGTTRLIATVQGSTAADTTTVSVQQAVAQVSAVGATSRTGTAGTAVADSVAIRVVDRNGNGVPGVAVTFAAANGGSLSPATTTTRADGIARAQWTLGPTAGSQTATATAAGLPAVTFTGTAAVGAVARVALTPETIRFNYLYQTQALSVQAFDAFNNPVPGQQATIISDNSAVVSLETSHATGGVLAQSRANGTARLIATVAGSTAADTTVVTVQQIAVRIALSPSSATLTVGQTVQLQAVAHDGRDAGGAVIQGATFTYSSNTPAVAVSATGLVTAVSATEGATITVRTDSATATMPVVVLAGLVASSVSATFDHSCALDTAGRAYCWGLNSSGQIMTGTTSGPDQCRGGTVGCHAQAIHVGGGLRFKQISITLTETCALSTGGALYCRGPTNTFTKVPTDQTFESLSQGYPYCALTSADEVLCGFTATGAGDLEPLGVDLASLASAGSNLCGLAQDGTAYCWGDNGLGQVGDGTTTPRTKPVRVATDEKFSVISPGGGSTCGVTLTGVALCWGANTYGQLGNGSTAPSLTPVPVSGGHRWRMVSIEGARACGVTTANEAYCWGAKTYGRNGISSFVTTPEKVPGEVRFATLETSSAHTCGIDTAGRTHCWGYNIWGQLGDATTNDNHTPQYVRVR